MHRPSPIHGAGTGTGRRAQLAQPPAVARTRRTAPSAPRAGGGGRPSAAPEARCIALAATAVPPCARCGARGRRGPRAPAASCAGWLHHRCGPRAATEVQPQQGRPRHQRGVRAPGQRRAERPATWCRPRARRAGRTTSSLVHARPFIGPRLPGLRFSTSRISFSTSLVSLTSLVRLTPRPRPRARVRRRGRGLIYLLTYLLTYCSTRVRAPVEHVFAVWTGPPFAAPCLAQRPPGGAPTCSTISLPASCRPRRPRLAPRPPRRRARRGPPGRPRPCSRRRAAHSSRPTPNSSARSSMPSRRGRRPWRRPAPRAACRAGSRSGRGLRHRGACGSSRAARSRQNPAGRGSESSAPAHHPSPRSGTGHPAGPRPRPSRGAPSSFPACTESARVARGASASRTQAP